MALFSNPANVNALTPPKMQFRQVSKPESPCYPGQMVEYQIRVAPGIWMSWLTEITACKEQSYFIDEQRRGPYKLWHHKHGFEEVVNENGQTVVKLTDAVTYQLYGGPIGRLMNAVWIRGQLQEIFAYRKKSSGAD